MSEEILDLENHGFINPENQGFIQKFILLTQDTHKQDN